jgi:dTDP-4-amino-4,6-dideoxygalactose transaminase
LGAKPILIDSDASTWNMDPELLEEVIIDRIAKNKKPKAVIVVHLYGMPAQIERIEAICKKYKVALIEDAAEALGSIINGRKAGSFGDLSVLSFNGNKIITTSGGGALLSKNEALIKRSRFLATQARDDEAHFEHSELGYNYRMSNVLAGIGRGQLKVLDNHIERRREINSLYQRALQIDGIEFQIESGKGVYSNYWLTAITIDNEKVGRSREEVRLKLWESNIETRPLWKPMHLQPLYKGCSYYGNGVCDELFENGLCLPSGSNLTDSDVSRVIEGFLNARN